MGALGTLPSRSETWEAGMLRGAFEVEGVELEGVILVVEAESNRVRLVTAVQRGEDVARVARTAFEAPAEGTQPGRPRRFHCADPELLRRLGPLLAEARTKGALSETPAVDEAVASLLHSFGAPRAPGITVDVGAWRAVLDRLVATAPWRMLPDSVEFAFEGGALDGAVAVVLGLAEQVYGVALYPTRRDLLTFRRVMRSPSALEKVRCVTVHLEPASELTAGERRACVGLALAGGLYPRVYAMEGGAARPAGPPEQAALRKAVEGVLAACDGRLAALAQGQRAEARVSGGVVRVGRHGSAGRAATPLAQEGAIVLMTMAPNPREAALPTLVLKFRKAEAERVAFELGAVAGLELRHGADGLVIRAGYSTSETRDLATLPAGELTDAILRHFGASRAWLVVAGGGTTRTVRERDLVRVVQVGVRRTEERK